MASVHPGDRELISQMKAVGQQLDHLERETTHYLHLPSYQAAQDAALSAEEIGFRTLVYDRPTQGLWTMLALHSILLNEETITAARTALTGVAAANGGEYDGWEADSDEIAAADS